MKSSKCQSQKTNEISWIANAYINGYSNASRVIANFLPLRRGNTGCGTIYRQEQCVEHTRWQTLQQGDRDSVHSSYYGHFHRLRLADLPPGPLACWPEERAAGVCGRIINACTSLTDYQKQVLGWVDFCVTRVTFIYLRKGCQLCKTLDILYSWRGTRFVMFILTGELVHW